MLLAIIRRDKMDNREGGYTIPDNIAIQLLQLFLLQLLSERARLKNFYYFDRSGFKVIKGEPNNGTLQR